MLSLQLTPCNLVFPTKLYPIKRLVFNLSYPLMGLVMALLDLTLGLSWAASSAELW